MASLSGLKDLVLLLLWHRPEATAATALICPQGWEPPCDVGSALKKKKKKERKRKKEKRKEKLITLKFLSTYFKTEQIHCL